MFDLQIDKKKKTKNKKLSSMNKSCEKKATAHSQNILHVDVLYNIKRNTKQFVQNWHSFIIFLIKINYCPSIYYLKTQINLKQ
jgi:hypothetical protein